MIEIAVAGGVIVLLGAFKIVKKLGYKRSKKLLKKALITGFENLEYDDIKIAITALMDFDSKNSTKKLEKYLLQIVNEFRENNDKLDINEANLKNSLRDLSQLHTIFDQEPEETDELNDMIDEKIDEVNKRRKEVMLRKNQIKSRVSRIKPRRQSSAMG
ncbi:MAG: hypothetical protein IH795_10815 [Bacteroidetes bacterium]|nr:hypothetical protein [Bacteroidota bacterium]